MGQPAGDAPEDYARLAGHHGVLERFDVAKQLEIVDDDWLRLS